MSTKPFVFEAEFTPEGNILAGRNRTHVSADEVRNLTQTARAEGEAAARKAAEARSAAAVDRILAQLAPVEPILARALGELRREAAELAMTAARVIAGRALESFGTETALAGVEQALKNLPTGSQVTVLVAPDAVAPFEAGVARLNGNGRIRVEADPRAKIGDWRVSWTGGSTGVSRDEVVAAVEAAIAARLDDPVEVQLDLFAA